MKELNLSQAERLARHSSRFYETNLNVGYKLAKDYLDKVANFLNNPKEAIPKNLGIREHTDLICFYYSLLDLDSEPISIDEDMAMITVVAIAETIAGILRGKGMIASVRPTDASVELVLEKQREV